MEKLRRKLYRLEYKYGKYSISNLMSYICATTLAVYFLEVFLNVHIVQHLVLTRWGLLHGQIWRALTFIFIPPGSSLLFTLLAIYFYYKLGSTLEDYWGSFKFNLYYLTGIIGVIIAALISGYGTVDYLNMSIFLAFAQLFPETEVLLFFAIPIKIKYIGYVDIAMYLLAFLFGNIPTKVCVLFSLLNFMLFFGDRFISDIKTQIRIMKNRRDYRGKF